ncbi:MAG TPA: DegT/DnrJ/EryC1/StrS family aminotransferase, partial [Methanocorpusculum sp.]|nr:DegT/DnrJ/EryC1/StrS family aminotransferase [Methanocorpusculum sp.]
MDTSSISGFIVKHAEKNTVSFHMPGHKGSAIYKRYGYEKFLNNIMDCDITEFPGADNLFQTEGIIKKVQEKYAALYGVKNSYLLVNGSSGGVIASILSSVPKGGKLILARNCHKSVYNALILGDITPVYAYPEMIHEYGISGAVSVDEIKRCLDENPDASAVILPSPNYYGICSDIKSIAELVHSRGKILITDQAHGAHLKFFSQYGYDLPKSAEESGSDLIINSIHKTLASFTQSALLNLNSDLVDRYVLEDKLQMIQTTSPSYLLMASLDINAEIVKEHGKEIFSEWYNAIMQFYENADKIAGLDVIRDKKLDFTKINLDMSRAGFDAAHLEAELIERGIYPELTTGDILMCMSGVGNTSDDINKLLDALSDISKKFYGVKKALKKDEINAVFEEKLELCDIPIDKERVPLQNGAGRVCASSIIPYPPGIPFVCPGERINEDVIEYIKNLKAIG